MPRQKYFTPLLGNQTKNRHGQITTKVSFAAYSEFVDLINIRVLTRVTGFFSFGFYNGHSVKLSKLLPQIFQAAICQKYLFSHSQTANAKLPRLLLIRGKTFSVEVSQFRISVEQNISNKTSNRMMFYQTEPVVCVRTFHFRF